MEELVNEWLEQAITSYKQTIAEFGDKWILTPQRSVEMWLRGYNAGEHNNKAFNACMEKLNEIKID